MMEVGKTMEGDWMLGAQIQRILVIDDETSLRTVLFRALDRQGYQVITAGSVKEAEMFSSTDSKFDLAIVDINLPDGDGIELMLRLKNLNPNLQSIVLTGNGTIEEAVRATRGGAFHFVTKPFNLEEITNLVGKALSHQTLQQENQALKNALQKRYRFDNIIGQSSKIRKVLEMVERVADSDSTILITGESGTGKELIAKAIHYNSTRASKPFVPINCGAIPSELLESELFGHMKGAFTGAIANRMGRFDAAQGGTIFLDEIGELSLNLQVKLLRVLQERRYEPVGSSKTIEADVRVIAATNVDLHKAVAKGLFREDLFYRLNVIPIHVPSLKERREDIPLLIHYFIQQFNVSKGRKLAGVAVEAMQSLQDYAWPGNIRELENLVERLAILKGQGIVEIDDLPEQYSRAGHASLEELGDQFQIPETGVDFNSAVDAYENHLILRALERTGWNRNQAATLLRLNRTTLVEKMKKKGLRPPDEEANA